MNIWVGILYDKLKVPHVLEDHHLEHFSYCWKMYSLVFENGLSMMAVLSSLR